MSVRWWLAYSHYRDWSTPELLRLGWEPFATDANGMIFLRKHADTQPKERAELYAMIPGQS